MALHQVLRAILNNQEWIEWTGQNRLDQCTIYNPQNGADKGAVGSVALIDRSMSLARQEYSVAMID